ncbi:MAG: hypothetical protein V4689_11145 [Verrucomicrobiota bacterium]
MSDDPDTNIVLQMPRSKKGRYVAASRAEGLTLATWIMRTLDANSTPFPSASEKQSRDISASPQDPPQDS